MLLQISPKPKPPGDPSSRGAGGSPQVPLERGRPDRDAGGSTDKRAGSGTERAPRKPAKPRSAGSAKLQDGRFPPGRGAKAPSGRRPGRPSGGRPAGPRPTGARPSGGTGSGRPSSRPADAPSPRSRPDRPTARRAPEDRPYGTPADSTFGRPTGKAGRRPSRQGRPSRRPSDRPSGTGRPPSDRPSRPPANRPPTGRSPAAAAGGSERSHAAGPEVPPDKKFDPNRPRDTRAARSKPEPKRRLTAEESFGLPKSWIVEIQELARPGTGPRVAEAVSKALEHFAEEEYEEAVRLASEAKTHAPRSPQVCELLGLSLYHAGNWKEALSELLNFRRLTSSVEHNHVIADVYRALGRPDRALETTAEVSPADVTREVWVETMIVASGALADKGDLNRAITMLARADPGSGAVEPYFLRHWYARADLLERAGRRAEARDLWRKIVAEDPEFFDAEERLASV